MKKNVLLCLLFIFLLGGCSHTDSSPNIAATTLPVYDFTMALCEGTGLTVERVITESVSCLHDYTLQVRQMQLIEGADCIVISGAGLEDFLNDVLNDSHTIIDSAKDIALLCGSNSHDDHGHEHAHTHESDPHIWLSPENAKIMAYNICEGLSKQYPEHASILSNNLQNLTAELDALIQYGEDALHTLSSHDIITFHDGFAYLADAYHLHILRAVEEESGSEASAAELKELIACVRDNHLRAIFTESEGSTAAADIISAETGVPVFTLNMGISGEGYFLTMYHNINTLKEALE